MGRLIALSLLEQGHQVTLFDKDSKAGKNSAAYAAAGLLTPLGEAMHSPANIVEMGFAALKCWPNILAKLDGYTYFQHAGSIVVSHEQDLSDYQRFTRFLESNYSQYALKKLNREQLLALEPELGRSFNQGLFLPEEGQLGNRKLLIALEKQLELAGVVWQEHSKVLSIDEHESSVTIDYQQGQAINQARHQTSYDFIVDCRGSGARENTTKAKPLSDLRAVRGELFQLYAPHIELKRPIRLMHPRYQLYIAPKTKGFYVVGATEVESEDLAPMTVRSSMELLSAAYSVHPGFAEANIRQHVTQLRPAFSDNQPQIFIDTRIAQVNGLYRHGFLVAPIVLAQLEFAIEQRLLTLGGQPSQPLAESPYHSLLAIEEKTTPRRIKSNL
ncbi:FAD-dependent oxidoreductase [Thalassotalea sp. M1531]|uniref:FAD-dependent oxidoreductase n=2 Tax=Thalassotalea algicola TaxID=2716224 RepID=A0A7Y0LA40_9GAMM|nr:FAD-dependent oxidoreductase [Thalassotalea algicola]